MENIMNEENINASEEHQVPCICGQTMKYKTYVPDKDATRKCDICKEELTKTDAYHCYNNKVPAHPKIICYTCGSEIICEKLQLKRLTRKYYETIWKDLITEKEAFKKANNKESDIEVLTDDEVYKPSRDELKELQKQIDKEPAKEEVINNIDNVRIVDPPILNNTNIDVNGVIFKGEEFNKVIDEIKFSNLEFQTRADMISQLFKVKSKKEFQQLHKKFSKDIKKVKKKIQFDNIKAPTYNYQNFSIKNLTDMEEIFEEDKINNRYI